MCLSIYFFGAFNPHLLRRSPICGKGKSFFFAMQHLSRKNRQRALWSRRSGTIVYQFMGLSVWELLNELRSLLVRCAHVRKE